MSSVGAAVPGTPLREFRGLWELGRLVCFGNFIPAAVAPKNQAGFRHYGERRGRIVYIEEGCGNRSV
jgi:hypothetical protein